MYRSLIRLEATRLPLVAILVGLAVACGEAVIASEPVNDPASDTAIIVTGRRDDNSINVTGRRISPDAEIRLYTVGYRLATSNQNCKFPQMWTGLVANDLSYYNAETRAVIEKNYDVTYGFVIVSVIKRSAAARAGFKPGDEIIGVSGSDLRNYNRYKVGKDAVPWRTLGLQYDIEEKLAKGPVKITVRRSKTPMEISLTGEPGCGGLVRIDHAEESRNLDLGRNAWYDGVSVAISARLVNFTKSDDELAFVVAHQMAHNVVGDYFKMTGLFPFRRQGMTRSDSLVAESNADRLAVQMVSHTSYDPSASLNFLRRASDIDWLFQPDDHPDLTTRIATVTDELHLRKLANASEETPWFASKND